MSGDRVEYHITSSYVQIVAEGHILPAFWAHPDVGGQFSGVALIHDRWGLTPRIRRLAQRLAAAGYYVVAPDLFDRYLPGTVDEANHYENLLGEAGLSYVAAALTAIQTHHRCNGDLATIGFNMGATLALHMALHREEVKAAALFNPTLADNRLLLPTDTTAILAFYGAGPGGVPANQLADIRTAFQTGAGARELVIYPEAGGDFFDETRPEYLPTAAQDAWERTLDFLSTHLMSPSHPPRIRDRFF